MIFQLRQERHQPLTRFATRLCYGALSICDSDGAPASRHGSLAATVCPAAGMVPGTLIVWFMGLVPTSKAHRTAPAPERRAPPRPVSSFTFLARSSWPPKRVCPLPGDAFKVARRFNAGWFITKHEKWRTATKLESPSTEVETLG